MKKILIIIASFAALVGFGNYFEKGTKTAGTKEEGIFHTDRGGNGSIAQWLFDAVNGNVRVVGLDCFDK